MFLFWCECKKAKRVIGQGGCCHPRPSNKSTRLFWLCKNRHWRPTWVSTQIVGGFTENPRPQFAWQLHVNTHKCLLQENHWLWALPSVVLSALHFPTRPFYSVRVNALIKCIHGQSGCWRTESMTWIVYFHLCLYQTPCSLSCHKTPAYSSLCEFIFIMAPCEPIKPLLYR